MKYTAFTIFRKTYFSSDSKLCTRRSWTSSSSLIPAGDNLLLDFSVFSELKVGLTRNEAGRRQGWIWNNKNYFSYTFIVNNYCSTSSSSPSAFTTVKVLRVIRSSKWGGEYPGARDVNSSLWLLTNGFVSTSGDSNSPLRSSMVLCRSRSRSCELTSLDLWALSSTDSLVMDDLEIFQCN